MRRFRIIWGAPGGSAMPVRALFPPWIFRYDSGLDRLRNRIGGFTRRHMIDPSDASAPKLTSIEVKFDGERRPFHLFDDEFQASSVKVILSGEKYPVPPIDRQGIDCVFDVGANIGAASVFFAATYPNASIHAFEPNHLSAPVLKRNIEGIERIAFHPFGLSDRDGEAVIRIAGSGGGASSIKSEVETADSHPITLRDAGPCLGGLATGKKAIVVKVDTEGCDAEILESIAGLFPRIQVVYVEYHSENQRRRIDRTLTGHGMLLFNALALRPHRGDLYYVRESIVARLPHFDRYRCD